VSRNVFNCYIFVYLKWYFIVKYFVLTCRHVNLTVNLPQTVSYFYWQSCRPCISPILFGLRTQ